MACTKQTARVWSTAKGQGISAIGADHQSIGQLLAKLPDRSKSSVDPALTPAESIDQPVNQPQIKRNQPKLPRHPSLMGVWNRIADKTRNDLNTRVEKWDQEQILIYPQPWDMQERMQQQEGKPLMLQLDDITRDQEDYQVELDIDMEMWL